MSLLFNVACCVCVGVYYVAAEMMRASLYSGCVRDPERWGACASLL
jgi:hypothetical protein